MNRKIQSLIEVKRKLKEMRIDDNSFSAIKELNICFKEYIYGKEINVIIPFPEFNKEIYVQLDTEFPENNLVVFKHLQQ